jgi:hypothetical protein
VNLISASIARIVSSTADLAILNHLIACDRQIYAERLGNSEHEPYPTCRLLTVSPFYCRLVFLGTVSRLPVVGFSFRNNATRTATVALNYGVLTSPLRVPPRRQALSSSNRSPPIPGSK